jgi:hypothetical protein
MQIHEITALNENFLARMAKGARDNAFRRATGVDWDTYKLAQTAGQSAPAATPVTPTPAATKPPLKPVGFNAANIMQQPGMQKYAAKPKPNYAQTGQVNYKPATVTVNSPGAPKVNPAAAPVIYTLDGRKLDPKNLGDAGVIKQLQAQGLTSGFTK